MDWIADPVADLRWQRLLRRHFDRAASSYGNHAGVQRRCDDAAMARWQFAANTQGDRPTGRVLEAGCGDGHLARQLVRLPGVSELVALDLSEAMLRGPAWPAAGGPMRLCADASALPLADAAVDAVVSHFALHWCPSPLAVLTELGRVLVPGGQAHLVIPVAGSLPGRAAASEAFEQADETLRPLADWQAAAQAAGWQVMTEAVSLLGEHHPDPPAWLAAIKAMGVTARRDAGAGLAGRARHQALMSRLEALREPAGIPLCYRVWQVCLKRDA